MLISVYIDREGREIASPLAELGWGLARVEDVSSFSVRYPLSLTRLNEFGTKRYTLELLCVSY